MADYFMDTPTKKRRVVGEADLIVTSNPEDTLTTNSLCSDLAVLLFDHKEGIGGLLHTMLPDSNIEKIPQDSVAFNPYKYVDTGTLRLFKKVYKAGALKHNLTLSVFGGCYGNTDDKFDIGKRNFLDLRKVAWQEGLLIKNEHVGGSRVNRTVIFDIQDGRITLDVDKKEVFIYG